MNARPRVITRSDPAKLVLEWTDGETTEFTTTQLRGLCPCALCVHELTGKRMHDPASVPADLTHKEVKLVGNYALAIAFGDGHDTGIFPFGFLRDNDPA